MWQVRVVSANFCSCPIRRLFLACLPLPCGAQLDYPTAPHLPFIDVEFMYRPIFFYKALFSSRMVYTVPPPPDPNGYSGTARLLRLGPSALGWGVLGIMHGAMVPVFGAFWFGTCHWLRVACPLLSSPPLDAPPSGTKDCPKQLCIPQTKSVNTCESHK